MSSGRGEGRAVAVVPDVDGRLPGEVEDGSRRTGVGEIGPHRTGAGHNRACRALEMFQGFRDLVVLADAPGMDEGWVTH